MLKIKQYIFALLQLLCLIAIGAQNTKTLIQEDFSIRDFVISKDSIFYIKKRTACLYEKRTKASKCFFIGGYGLELIAEQDNNFVITIANELVDTLSSIRFYNKKDDKFEAEYFYNKGKILDFLNIPETSLFAISLTNNKILFIDYENLPRFLKTIEIKLNSLCRKLIYKNSTLYFSTDNGNIYKYDVLNYNKTLLYSANKIITDFIIFKNILIYTTIEGDICKLNLDTEVKSNVKIDNNFISALVINENYLVCGSWSGMVYLVDLSSFSIQKSWPIHKRAILKIKKGKNNIMYSSGLDKTIKSWKIH